MQMYVQLLCDHRHNGLFLDLSINITRTPSRRPLCRSKHNYHTDIHPASRRPLCRCKKANIIGPPSQRPLCRYKYKYHTTTVTTASIQMSIQLFCDHRANGLYANVNITIIRPSSQRPLYRSKHDYHTDIRSPSRRPLCKCKYK